jgi:hypothetical protein
MLNQKSFFRVLNFVVFSYLTLCLFQGCKEPEPNQIKYEITVSKPINLNLSYENQFGNVNTEVVNADNWSKVIEVVDTKYFQVIADPGFDQAPFTITGRIYYKGKVVEEVSEQADVNGSSGYLNLQYYLP